MAERRPATRKGPKSRKQASQRKRVAPQNNYDKKAGTLKRELADALERQAITAEVLRIVNRSTFDLQSVLDTLTVSAAQLCNADMASMSRQDAGGFHHVTNHGFPADWIEYNKSIRLQAGRGSIVGRSLMDGKVVQVADVLADPDYAYPEPQKKAGYRTFLAVPLLRDGHAIGVLSLCRKTVRPFTEKQIDLVASFADQAVIAIENVRLFDEVRARTEELHETLQQQTATADVLKVISRSTFDLPAVLGTLLASATRLCEADFGNIARPSDDGTFLVQATYGASAEFTELMKRTPMRAGRGSAIGRALEERTTIHILDAQTDLEYELTEAREVGGFHTLLGVPLMREGTPIGVFAIGRHTVRPFTERQIELVTTFADQAAIAIENVRLFNETKEALERQTATAEILSVISSSPTDTQPVFDAIVHSGLRLFPDATIGIALPDADQVKAVAVAEPDPVRAAAWRDRFPFPLTREYMHSVAILDAREVDVPDVADAPASMAAGARNFLGSGYRAVTIMPMLRGSAAIGVLSVVRLAPGPLTDNQRAMLKTFADQAVIAIENTRLLNELRQRTDDLTEALRQQTATGEILATISASPTDAKPVFDTIVRNLLRLFGTRFAVVQVLKDGMIYMPALDGEPGFERLVDRYPRPIDESTGGGRAMLSRKVVQYSPVIGNPEAPASTQDFARDFGFDAVVFAPMLRGETMIGAIGVAHHEPRTFDAKQIALIQAFADQAVIAIENTRLFDALEKRTADLTEALQQQTATADVLKVISRSAFDLQLVLDTLVESATRLCGADHSWLFQREDDDFRWAAGYGHEKEVHARIREYFLPRKVPLDRGSVTGRSALEKRIIHVTDVLADPDYKWGAAQEIGGYRCVLGVPLLREGNVVGVIFLAKMVPEPFAARQIELAASFADQAVIAIENARLFAEVQTRTEELNEALQQQTATAEVLKVISRSAFDLKTVLHTLVESAVRLTEADKGTITRMIDGEFYRAESVGFSQEFMDYVRTIPVRPEKGSATGRALLEGVAVHIPDFQTDKEYTFTDAQRFDSFRTMLSVPLLREGTPIGVLVVVRSEVRPFTDRQIDLVTTFADQAAIAIENSRLFEEVQSRTKELTRSLEDLQLAQARLVQTEKLASLGQLTAGIAHEIKNPLNFVNNFSAVSAELIEELSGVLKPAALDSKMREEIDELTRMLKGNLDKVVQHGKRADSIVKNMLLHSRQGSEQQHADINAIVEESLNLAYHGARAERTGFNITLQRNLDPEAGMIELYPQEITRVFLNLISNGFYSATKRKEAGGENFEPTLSATTKSLGDRVEIRIRDNGSGIPQDVKERIFNPFFTTKPAGEGTGLGLSMSHDIVVKQHGGKIDVETRPDEFTEFIITLPRTIARKQEREM